MDRREFVAGALASPLLLAARAEAQTPIYIGDMHFHSFFGDSKYHSRPVAQALSAGGATLVSWSLGGDILWFDSKTYKQKSVPHRVSHSAGFSASSAASKRIRPTRSSRS